MERRGFIIIIIIIIIIIDRRFSVVAVQRFVRSPMASRGIRNLHSEQESGIRVIYCEGVISDIKHIDVFW